MSSGFQYLRNFFTFNAKQTWNSLCMKWSVFCRLFHLFDDYKTFGWKYLFKNFMTWTMCRVPNISKYKYVDMSKFTIKINWNIEMTRKVCPQFIIETKNSMPNSDNMSYSSIYVHRSMLNIRNVEHAGKK